MRALGQPGRHQNGCTVRLEQVQTVPKEVSPEKQADHHPEMRTESPKRIKNSPGLSFCS